MLAHQVQQAVRCRLAGEAVVFHHEIGEEILQPHELQIVQRCPIPVGHQVVLAGEGTHSLRDARHGPGHPGQGDLFLLTEDGYHGRGIQAVFIGDDAQGVGQVVFQKGQGLLRGDLYPEALRHAHKGFRHGGVGVHHRAVKIPEEVPQRRGVQRHGAGDVRVCGAEGVDQHLPGGHEGTGLVLGELRLGLCGSFNKVEQDALGLPPADLSQVGHGQTQFLQQLPLQAIARGFACFDLPAGEFPQTGVAAALATLADQHPAVRTADDPG